MFSIIEVLFLVILLIYVVFYTFYFILMLSSSKNYMKTSTTVPTLVSLVIPVHNEEKNIVRKLKNAFELIYPFDKLEILVVNDGSSDNTVQVVEEFVKNDPAGYRVTFYSLPKWSGKASALNFAWQHCMGQIVVMTDADVMLQKEALGRIVDNFVDPTVGAVSGRLCVAVDECSTSISEMNYRSIFDIIRLGESELDSTPIFNGLIMAFRRNVLGTLDTKTLADDTELSLAAREKGWRAKYDPDVVAYEEISEDRKVRLKQKLRRGRGIVQAFWLHKKMLFNPRYGSFGLIIFPSEIFMHIVSPILLIFLLVLFPFVLLNLSISLNLLAIIGFVLISLFIGLFLILNVRKNFLPSKKGTINPFAIISTFVVHQVYLILVLFSFLSNAFKLKKKSDDIKDLWITKN